MQREIKFRAWDKKKRLMIPLTDNYICEEYSGILFTAPEDHEYNGIGSLPGSYQGLADGQHYSEQYELMQYTGLKDKNGKEIYEGDILAIPDAYHDYQDGIAINELPENRLEHVNWAQATFWAGDECLSEEASHSEVIGNIYENRELLQP